MFRKKKKEEFYKECIKLYDEDIKSNIKDKSNHDDILELKNKIRDNYIEKINKNELDIMSEKIRLENAIGKYNTAFIGYSTSLYIAIMAGIFGYYFQSSGILNIGRIKGLSDLTNDIIITIAKFVTFMILIFVLTALMGDKSITKNKKMSLINNVKLKVLEGIEKEINEGKLKKEKEVSRKELIEQIQDKNSVIDTVVPIITEVTANIIFRKIFNKLRRK